MPVTAPVRSRRCPTRSLIELVIHGTPDDCRAHIDRYLDNGVTTTSLSVMPFGGIDMMQAIRDLAPDNA